MDSSNGDASAAQDFTAQLARARAGSAATLGELLEGCRQYLQAVAQRSLDSAIRPKVAPSDIVQETFLEAKRGFARFRGSSRGQFLAWLRQILLNNLCDHVRARSREARLQVPLGANGAAGWDPPAFVDGRATPRSLLAARETAEALEAALAQLSSDHQAVIRMRHQQGLPFDEIARRMGRSTNAAQKLWMRAICQLREKLADLGER